MQAKTLPYHPGPSTAAGQTASTFTAVSLSPEAPASGLASLCSNDTQVLDGSLLPFLYLILRLQATVTGPAPSLTVAIAGQTFTLDLTGQDRLAGSYVWQPQAATPSLLPVSGGAIGTTAPGWQIVTPMYATGALPTTGAIALTVQATWADMTLDAALLEGTMAHP